MAVLFGLWKIYLVRLTQ